MLFFSRVFCNWLSFKFVSVRSSVEIRAQSCRFGSVFLIGRAFHFGPARFSAARRVWFSVWFFLLLNFLCVFPFPISFGVARFELIERQRASERESAWAAEKRSRFRRVHVVPKIPLCWSLIFSLIHGCLVGCSRLPSPPCVISHVSAPVASRSSSVFAWFRGVCRFLGVVVDFVSSCRCSCWFCYGVCVDSAGYTSALFVDVWIGLLYWVVVPQLGVRSPCFDPITVGGGRCHQRVVLWLGFGDFCWIGRLCICFGWLVHGSSTLTLPIFVVVVCILVVLIVSLC